MRSSPLGYFGGGSSLPTFMTLLFAVLFVAGCKTTRLSTDQCGCPNVMKTLEKAEEELEKTFDAYSDAMTRYAGLRDAVLAHHAKTNEELRRLIENNPYQQTLENPADDHFVGNPPPGQELEGNNPYAIWLTRQQAFLETQDGEARRFFNYALATSSGTDRPLCEFDIDAIQRDLSQAESAYIAASEALSDATSSSTYRYLDNLLCRLGHDCDDMPWVDQVSYTRVIDGLLESDFVSYPYDQSMDMIYRLWKSNDTAPDRVSESIEYLSYSTIATLLGPEDLSDMNEENQTLEVTPQQALSASIDDFLTTEEGGSAFQAMLGTYFPGQYDDVVPEEYPRIFDEIVLSIPMYDGGYDVVWNDDKYHGGFSVILWLLSEVSYSGTLADFFEKEDNTNSTYDPGLSTRQQDIASTFDLAREAQASESTFSVTRGNPYDGNLVTSFSTDIVCDVRIGFSIMTPDRLNYVPGWENRELFSGDAQAVDAIGRINSGWNQARSTIVSNGWFDPGVYHVVLHASQDGRVLQGGDTTKQIVVN